MKSAIFTLSLFLSLNSFCYAQLALDWVRFYGDDDYETLADIYPLTNGNFAATGSNDNTIWVLLLNDNGRIIWENTYGISGFSYGRSLIETDDGDLIIGGFQGENASDYYFTALRVDPDGELIWIQNYGPGSCQAVIELKNGAIALAGRSNSLNAAKLIIVDENGDEIRSRDYRHGNRPSFMGMKESEEGIVLVSAGQSGAIWSTRVDFNLDVVWVQDYHFGDVSAVTLNGNSFVSNGNDGFAFCVTFTLNGWWPGFVLIDSNGQLINWIRYEVDRDPYKANSLIAIPDAGFLIAGGLSSGSLMYVDTEGEILWQQTLERPQEADHTIGGIYCIVKDNDDSLVVCGQGWRENVSSGMAARIEGILPHPSLLSWFPEDTLLTCLIGDSINFKVQAIDQFNNELVYQFWVSDTLFTLGDSVWIKFDSFGITDVECRIINDRSVISIRWHVTVTDLYVSAYSPDTLYLSIRRGDSVDFSLDTVGAVEGLGDVEYQWTKSFRGDPPEIAGTESRATIPFMQSGNYAVEGLAYRGESSDAVTWNVSVRGVVWSFAPEDLALEVLPDSLIRFEVIPSNPEDSSLSVRWFVDDELAAEDTTSLDWGFFYPVHSVHNIYCVLADSVEVDTVSWTVTVRDLSVKDKRDAYPTRSAALLSVSPNPFNSTLTIRYSSPINREATSISIYDISGREVFSAVAALSVTEENSRAVKHGGMTAERTLIWDASNTSAGVYFVRLQSGGEVTTKKVVLMR